VRFVTNEEEQNTLIRDFFLNKAKILKKKMMRELKRYNRYKPNAIVRSAKKRLEIKACGESWVLL